MVHRLNEQGITQLIDWLWDIAGHVKTNPFARIAAIKELLTRAIGKPEDTLNVATTQLEVLTFPKCVQQLEAAEIPESL